MTDIDPDVLRFVEDRGVTRLLHFTQSRNLPGILAEESLRDVESLRGDPFMTFASSDTVRADGHLDKLSFSIEYPNAYYLRDARARTDGYPDWVVFAFSPYLSATMGTLFSPYNAAKSGAPRVPGASGIEACYASTVRYSRTVTRASSHNKRSPTDIQAELLIPGPILLSGAIGIVTQSPEDALLEMDRLEFLGQDPTKVEWLVSPDMFDPNRVIRAVRQSAEIDVFDLNGGRV
ncbi:DarT ssDNA thymidine ADP-ribosyltransferase family protein [Microbacterium sp. LMI1x-1-1.1]|uniref:DarT ssDNA thymidine ADP-ribosyltransferase family protein n=1 Tax=Microbacterium sp. LMI1x-1-1.1 TaxID=3135246 RepID=UPI00341E4A46